MKASLFYRIAAILLLVFAIGHTLGFSQSDPEWKADFVLRTMRTTHFDVQGFDRTYWDLFLAAGYCVGMFYLFAAILAWQLSRLPPDTLARMSATLWVLTLCFAGITIVSWMFLFIIPVAFSLAITIILAIAAWLATKHVAATPTS